MVWSKTKGTWLIFDTDEAGDYFYDPRKSNDGQPSCYSIAEVGLDTLEAPARQVHVEAAQDTAARFTSALNKAWVHFNDKLWGNPATKHDFQDGYRTALQFIGLRLADGVRSDRG